MQVKTKKYIDPEYAKKKIEQYEYWAIHDESGELMTSSDKESHASFSDILDKVLDDPVDAEFQIRFGSNEPRSRKNRLFIIGNENINWVEPEQQTVNINGTPHRVDRNGNVNINLSTPDSKQPEIQVETARIDTVRQEMEIRLEGIQRQYELERERMQDFTERKLAEQQMQFKEMMLQNRERELENERQRLIEWESELQGRQEDITENVKGYLKQVPTALGGLFKELVREGSKREDLAGTDEEEQEHPKTSQPRERRKVQFSIKTDEPEEIDEYDEPESIIERTEPEEAPEPMEEPANN